MKNSFKHGVLIIIFLLFGIFISIFMVSKNQDIRNKAKENGFKQLVCHRENTDTNEWVQIWVSSEDLKAHLEHGDILGNCPEFLDEVVVEKDPSMFYMDTPGDPAYIFNTSEEEKTTLTIKIRFPEEASKVVEKKARVLLRTKRDGTYIYNDFEFRGVDRNVFEGVLEDVNPGIYDVYIKPATYLQKKARGLYIKKGGNSLDINSEFVAGDFNNDNVLNSYDIAEFLSFYNKEEIKVDDENAVFDVDLNGVINQNDLNMTLSGYNSLQIKGEE